MNIKTWSADEKTYELSQGFSLKKAVNQEFSKYYAIYFNMDIGFKFSYEQKCAIVAEDDPCYWVIKDNKRVGGVFLNPNYIECLFLIPPFQDTYKVLSLLKDVLLAWSDESKPIKAEVVGPEQIDHYSRLGFRVSEAAHWMIRPTETYDVVWDDSYELRKPQPEDVEEIGAFFFEAFQGYVGAVEYSLEERTSFAMDYFKSSTLNDFLLEASTKIYDKQTKELVGICLISEFRGWPLVCDIGVKSSYRGKGLASKMLKKALTITSEKYSAMRLYVLSGNPAESVYYNLGFLPGEKLSTMYIPAPAVQDK